MTHPVLRPVALGPHTLRNRVVKAATFEGMTPGGRVSDDLVAHHAHLAARGVALTTVAYGCVHPDGRTFADQLLVDDATAPDLRRLADAVHAEGGRVALQLAHGGGFTKLGPRDGGPPAGPSAGWNAYGALQGLARVRALEEAELDGIVGAFAAAAVTAVSAGFDAVEIHAGHGYLLSQFLSPLFNHRRDAHGGDLAGRARLARRVVRAVSEAVGERATVLVKLNTRDGVRGGLELEEAAVVASWLAADGAHALVPSGGLVQRSAFYLLRGRTPLREMVAAEHDPMQRWALRLFGPLFVKGFPYRSTFLREDAARLRDAVDVPVGLLGGVDSAAAMASALEEGFGFVVLGRGLLADPDWVVRMEAGEEVVSRCTHGNTCVARMDEGVRCHLDGDGCPAR